METSPGAAAAADGLLASRLLAELGWVRRLALRLVSDRDRAEDVVQEVAAAALARRPLAGARFRSWLGLVTRRTARRTATPIPVLEGDPETRGPGPDSAASRLQLHGRLTEALSSLPEPYRSTVVSHYFDGASAAEIAAERGCSAASVHKQLQRGLARLRERMRREVGPDWRAVLLLQLGFELPVPTPPPPAPPTSFAPWTPWAATAGLVVVAATALLAAFSADGEDTRGGSEADPAARAPAGASGQDRQTARGPDRRDAARPALAALRLVDALDEPLADAEIVFMPRPVPAGLGEVRRTDARGELELDEATRSALRGRCDLLVVALNRPARRVALPRGGVVADAPGGTGSRAVATVRVPGSGVVRGRVTVRNAAPRTGPIDLLLVCRQGESFVSRTAEENRFVAVGHRVETRRTRVWPAPDGRFEVRGLDPDWHGWIGGHGNHLCDGAADGLEVSKIVRHGWVAVHAGMTDVELELVRVPGAHGRVVDPGGRPIRCARVEAEFTHEGRETARVSSVTTDVDGRFTVGFLDDHPGWRMPEAHPQLASATLQVGHHRTTTETLRFAMPDGQDTKGLGTIVLRSLPEVHARFLDRDGDPVAGARIFHGRDRPNTRSKDVSDDDGNLVFYGDRAAIPRAVAAPGFQGALYAPRAGAGSAASPLVYVLEEANGIVVHWPRDLLAPDELRVVARSSSPSEPLFTHPDGRGGHRPGRMHMLAGCDRSGRKLELGGAYAGRPDGDGSRRPVRLCSLEPGRAVELQIVDVVGQVLHARRVRAPSIGETLDVHFEGAGNAIAEIVCTVRATDQPPRARVAALVEPEFRPWSVPTEDGTARMRLAAGGRDAELLVSADFHATTRRRLALTPGVHTFEVDLPRGHPVTVEVVDPRGAPVAADVRIPGTVDRPAKQTKQTRADGLRAEAEELGPGRVLFKRLPAGPTPVEVSVGGRLFAREAVVAEAPPGRRPQLVTLTVPAPVEVRWTLPPRLARRRARIEIVVAPAPGGQEQVEASPVTQDLSWNGERWIRPSTLLYLGRYRVEAVWRHRDEVESWSTTFDVSGAQASIGLFQ